MAVRSLTYLDIPSARRRENAASAIMRLRERIADPLTTPEQSQKLRDQLVVMEQWINGTIPTT